MPRRVEIDDELHDLATNLCPKYLSVTGFLNLILDQHLRDHCGGSRLPTCRAGAGGRVEDISQSSPQLPTHHTTDFKAVHQLSEISPVSHTAVAVEEGESEGKEEETQTTITSPKGNRLVVPDNLKPHETLIREFWASKKGRKSQVAWKLLLTGITQIQDKYGDRVVPQQIMEAINGNWKGITLRGYEQYGRPKPKPAWQQQDEIKHPASRVFTADRGFDDDEPVVNSFLKDVLG